MNNDLEQFSEERLKNIIELADNPTMAALARIALASKQAKPVAYTDNLSLETLQLNGMACMWKEGGGAAWREQIPFYTTTQPAHTEQVIPDGWKLVPIEPTEAMLDEFDSIIDFGADDSVDAWRRLIAATPKPESE